MTAIPSSPSADFDNFVAFWWVLSKHPVTAPHQEVAQPISITLFIFFLMVGTILVLKITRTQQYKDSPIKNSYPRRYTMKMTKVLTTAMILGTFSIGTALILAGNVSARGPMSTANYDADGNGSVTEQEFNSAREQQQAQMKASGRMGTGMADAPSFADVDTDKDGLLSTQEVTAMQEKQQASRGQGRGQGKGKGGGNRN